MSNFLFFYRDFEVFLVFKDVLDLLEIWFVNFFILVNFFEY